MGVWLRSLRKPRISKQQGSFVGTHNEKQPNHRNKAAEIIQIHNLLSFGDFLACQGAIFWLFSL